MTAVFCRNSADRSRASWRQRLAPFVAPEFAVSDAAKGIASGLEGVARRRQSADDTTPSGQGLDLFHTAREARGVLHRAWQGAEAAWVKAEAFDVRVAASKREGPEAPGVAEAAAAAWRRAVRALGEVGGQGMAWRRARAALDLFDAEGRLNDRTRAEAEIAAARADLIGPEWKTARSFLRDRRSTAFPGRMHERLAQAEPRAGRRIAMAWRWWGRHRRATGSTDPRLELIHAVAWGRPLSETEERSYARVSEVLSGTVRAGGAVGCMNGVLRRRRSSHKRMTQEMLDLKRLYWKSHRLKAGERKDSCPYRHLGLAPPSFDFGELLQTDPEHLTRELSGQKDAG